MLYLCVALVKTCILAPSTHKALLHRPCRASRHSPARLRLVFNFIGGELTQGLMNQHLNTLNFLTLGIVLGADELVIVESRSRSNFSVNASWESRDFADLWNTTKVASFLAGGVTRPCTVPRFVCARFLHAHSSGLRQLHKQLVLYCAGRNCGV